MSIKFSYTSLIVLFYCLILCNLKSNAQVWGVKYQIKFNPDNCLYEARLIIAEGTATSAIHRAQFSAQYSIVVPTTSQLIIEQSHMPIQNNQGYSGSSPANWLIGSFIQNPIAMPGFDFYSITPSLTPTSFYNNLATGDTIKLFSFSVNPLPVCGYGVRPFDNDTDPDSSAPGMGGGDFMNGFTIGGPAQKYQGNEPTIYGKEPSITEFQAYCGQGIDIRLKATIQGCQTPLTYQWSGPMDYSSTLENVVIPSATFINNGNYKVIISDNIGCKDTLQLYSTVKPTAGNDQYVSCYISGVATLSSEGPGIWSVSSQSSGSANISDVNAPVTIVSGFSEPGEYFLLKTFNNCADTVLITVLDQCECAGGNIIELPSISTFCNQSGNLLLNAGLPDSAGLFQWQFSINNGLFQTAPGTSDLKDYTTQNLTVPGNYAFRRIFIKSGAAICKDTSNVIVLTVSAKPDAGSDHSLFCYEGASVKLNAIGTGYWYIGNGSEGTADFSAMTDPAAIVNNFSGPGTYYIIRANMFCSDTSIITIQDLCGCDSADGGGNRTACASTQLTLKGGCSSGIWSPYSLNPPGSFLVSQEKGDVRINYSNIAQGVYKYIFTVSDTLKDTINVVVSPIPTVDAGQDFSYCKGSIPVTIVAGGAISYLWSNGQTGSSITVSPENTTTYSVTGTNAAGCTGFDTVTVMVMQAPLGSIPSIPPCYENENMQLLAGNWTNAVAFKWKGPMNFSSTLQNPIVPNVQLENAGMYYLTVTSADDCVSDDMINIEILERALPVEFITFYGYYHIPSAGNQLHWETLSERNNDYFVLERSMDGILFEEIGRIKGDGTASRKKSYTSLDKDVFKGLLYYYRLKQVDFDGKFTYSKVINVRVPENKEDYNITFRLFPNPAANHCELSSETDLSGPFVISLSDFQGVVIFQHTFTELQAGENLLQSLNFDLLKPGIYSVNVVGPRMVLNRKLIVVK